MTDASRRWKILSIALMVILAAGFLAPKAFALNQTDLPQAIMTVVLQVKSLLTNSQYGLQAISNKVNTGANQTSVNKLQATDNAVKGNVTQIKAAQYVPFVATYSNVMVCAAHGTNADTSHDISIADAGMVSSVIVQPNDTLSNTDFVAVAFVDISGNDVFLPGPNFATTGSTPTDGAFDLMSGGQGFPHELTGSIIRLGLDCAHNPSDHNLAFKQVIVSGWAEAFGPRPTVTMS